MTKIVRGMFSLYENLLSNHAQTKWHNIVASQVDVYQWTYLNSKTHVKARKKTVTSFEDCATFHLLTVFPADAEEQQRYYINVSLRKPNKVTIRNFIARIEQVNSYLGRLPGLIDSPKKIKTTKAIEPFDEADFSQLILNMCPSHWQDQYAYPREYPTGSKESSWISQSY